MSNQPKLPRNAPLRIYTIAHIQALINLVQSGVSIEVKENNELSWKAIQLPTLDSIKEMADYLFGRFGDKTKLRVAPNTSR